MTAQRHNKIHNDLSVLTETRKIYSVSSRRPGASEHAQSQLFRALRYHTLQDPRLHDTLRDLLATVRAPGKGLSAAARLYLSRREFPLA